MRLLISFLVTVGIIGIIGSTFFAVYEIKNLKEQIAVNDKEIDDLKYENKRLRIKLKNANINKKLANDHKDYYKRKYEMFKKYNEKLAKNNRKKTYNNKKKDVEVIYSKNNEKKINDAFAKEWKKQNNKNSNTKKSKYTIEYSKNIKLVSDSKIHKRADGRLKANSAIYGRYYAKDYSVRHPTKNQISNIKCNLNQNLYNVVDECSMRISDDYDLVYLGRMEAKNIQNFNNKSHMIECNYNQQYGVMHKCMIKPYKYIF